MAATDTTRDTSFHGILSALRRADMDCGYSGRIVVSLLNQMTPFESAEILNGAKSVDAALAAFTPDELAAIDSALEHALENVLAYAASLHDVRCEIRAGFTATRGHPMSYADEEQAERRAAALAQINHGLDDGV